MSTLRYSQLCYSITSYPLSCCPISPHAAMDRRPASWPPPEISPMPLARDDLCSFFLVLVERPGRVNSQMCQRRPQPRFPHPLQAPAPRRFRDTRSRRRLRGLGRRSTGPWPSSDGRCASLGHIRRLNWAESVCQVILDGRPSLASPLPLCRRRARIVPGL